MSEHPSKMPVEPIFLIRIPDPEAAAQLTVTVADLVLLAKAAEATDAAATLVVRAAKWLLITLDVDNDGVPRFLPTSESVRQLRDTLRVYDVAVHRKESATR